LDQIIKPATDLTKLCLRKFAELAFHLLDFAHMQMIERIPLNFKPGVSQSSLSVFRFLPGNQPRHRGYDVDFRWYREFVTRNTVSSRMEASQPPRRPPLPAFVRLSPGLRRGKQQPLMHRSLLRQAKLAPARQERL